MPAQIVKIVDADNEGADVSGGGILVTSKPEKALINGTLFSAYHTASCDTGDSLEIAVTMPDTTTCGRYVYDFRSFGPVSLTLSEPTGSVTGGAAFTPVNRNGNSANVATASIIVGNDTDDALTYSGQVELWSERHDATTSNPIAGAANSIWEFQNDNATVFSLEALEDGVEMWLGVTWYEE